MDVIATGYGLDEVAVTVAVSRPLARERKL